MKNILARGGIEFLAVFIGIILSLHLDDVRDDRIVQNKNINNLRSLGNELDQRIGYVDKKISQYQRDISIGEYVIENWKKVDFNHVDSLTKNDRGIILTLKAYRAINLPTSVYNSLNSDGSIGLLENDSIKILINNLYEVFPSHIVDGVENERVLYHSFNKYIIENYPTITDREISKASISDYKRFFNDDIALGYTKEKTHIRKFTHRNIVSYRKRLQILRQKINLITTD
ncbi:MAG: hypothetical protein VXX52_03745 [Candidatus Neomarinimicrobiota bacterium]|nr:hypothetical protein [Candidatus Neomarinimicrobiota bacterium]MEC8689762.1 hypothetical protein [Candidatus Neomarinimicrobiota bacterium]MEC8706521.1 hypothetical protein [Candidatus Neomarinimicrobiota bacterium]|tara:strand:- start:1454 stop:2143 length:690 start_codon:yes stop_codon:yes gene_type:complete